MRIVWHSALGPTGYGTQTALWAPYLASRGHDVVISAYHMGSQPVSEVGGVPVLPPPLAPGGPALLPAYAKAHKADLVIILADFWIMNSAMVRSIPAKVATWLPIDTEPLSALDFAALKRTGATPIAMSLHGRAMLERAGWADPLYVPHGIDCQAWQPPADRDALRAGFGFRPQDFVVGMNFNNVDPYRKAAPQMMRAFRVFNKRHPKSTLWMHTITPMENSLDLAVIAATEKIRDHRLRLSDQERMQAADYSQADMRDWYGMLDVLMNATLGEGFGLPSLEAQACGTPVILSGNSTGPELAGPGWVVSCDHWPFWHDNHQSWWGGPSVPGLVKALEGAVKAGPFKRPACRVHAQKWDVSVVGPMWDDVLARLMSE